MSCSRGFPIAVVLGLAGAGACSDRKVEAKDEEAERLCGQYCEKYDECGVSLEGHSVDECMDNCVGFDWVWGPNCRAEYVRTYSCLNDLSCADFAVTEDFDAPDEMKSCRAENTSSSNCTAEHGGIDG